MAEVMSMRWAGVTPEQYDATREAVGWEERAPEGALMHVAWFEADALRVVDVWTSREDFERFFAERLAAAVKEAGITGEPETEFTPLHRRFVAPGVTGAA
ncbi:hypothetical protein [Kitasatospora sp. MAP5-34]|uniref:hypothetical protein n=1 Tax=Kitasatospora sp. MAP5-34 TaxID=3035102 RepID=UPI0024750C1E|nr:hypothetical protein [Kitasatospora sp. MAP5-34]MDH6580463.1 hypothetical protein [Kitasatospora sp. MAP5-34]